MTDYIKKCETKQTRAVFSSQLNANETVFGGELMKWMDETAYLTATRLTRRRMFTVKVDNVRFLKAIERDSIIELTGRVASVGKVKVKIVVEVFVEEMYGVGQDKALRGEFIFASLNEENLPVPIELPQYESA